MNNKNQQGASFIEFSLIAIIFFTVIFATVGLGIDAYHRFVAGEQAEKILKKVENTGAVFLDAAPMRLCQAEQADEIGMNEAIPDNADGNAGTYFCGFKIYDEDVKTCEEALERSVEENCAHDGNRDVLCAFWFNLYKIAKEYEKDSEESGGYLYGRVYGGENPVDCRASFSILLPGFNSEEEGNEGNGSLPNMKIKADDGDTPVLERLKNNEMATVKKYVPSIFDKFVGKYKRGKEIAHLGYVRTRIKRPIGDIDYKGDGEDPTPTPTGTHITPTPTNTYVPGEDTPTPTQTPECGYYQLNVKSLGWGLLNSNVFQKSEGFKESDCLNKIIEHASDVGKSYWYWGCWRNEKKEQVCNWIRGGNVAWFYQDDTIVYEFLKDFGGVGLNTCYGSYYAHYLHTRGSQTICKNFSFYIDKDCKVISEEEAKKSGENCGNLTASFYQSSPISLVFDENKDISHDMTITSFKLDLSKDKKNWTLWKASEDFPLLVYDKDHTGKVTDASELFGLWTFGGKTRNNKIPWINGYEALATLDTNFDGVLSGEELDPLALWFDKNRNAISEDGEVKPLKEFDITKIYFTNYSGQYGSKDLIAEVGYERIVDGKTITGKSIDWWTTIADSQEEVIQSVMREKEEYGKAYRVKKLRGTKDKEVLSVKSRGTSIGGIWNYYLSYDEEKGKTNKDGTFVFFENVDQEIKGFTFSQLNLKNDKVQNYVTATLIEGKYDKEGNKGSLTFEGELEGKKLKSTAKIMNNGLALEGNTEVYNNKNERIISYPWVAIKVK